MVNCIKAVSGSMANFTNSYYYGERVSKAHRISVGEKRLVGSDKFLLRTKKKKKKLGPGGEKGISRSLKCFSTTCRTQTAYPLK